MKCILCNSSNINKTASISNSDLIKLFKNRSGVDVKRFFSKEFTDCYLCTNCNLQFYYPQAIGDGKFYDDIQKNKNYYLNNKIEFDEAAKFIDPNDEVLEIGCGKGIFPEYIKCRSYTGIEFSDDAIKIATQKKITVLKQSIEEHASINSNKYDAVCFFQVLEHVSSPSVFLTAAIQCLKTGGKLIIAVPSEDSFIKNAPNFYLNMPPHHASKWTDEALKNIASIYNLELTHIFHESLQQEHKSFFLKTTINNYLSKVFKESSNQPTNTGIAGTLIYMLASIIAIPFSFFINGDKITGQSVLVVYKKK